MPNSVDFYGPNLKVERADHHITQLETIFWAYVRDSKKRLRPKPHRNKPPSISLSLPRHTPTVLGDALHNLRAALDHAYCILVEANGHTPNHRSFFPFVPTKPHLSVAQSIQDKKGSVKGHIVTGNGPSQAVFDCIFDDIQPYAGGKGEDLLALHDLDIADKHTNLLPQTLIFHAQHIAFSRPGGGGISFENISFASDQKNANFVRFPKSVTLENNGNVQSAADIVFPEGQPFERQSVVPTLKELKKRVEETLTTLRQKAVSATP